MGTPIHDMTIPDHEHRWVLTPRLVEKKVRSGVKSTTIQQTIACLDPNCVAAFDVKDRPAPTRRLEEEEFFEEFNPDNNGGNYYSYLAVQRLNEHYVWSVLEGGRTNDENLYAVPGFRHVNLVGYIVCTKPWTDDIIEAVWMEKDE